MNRKQWNIQEFNKQNLPTVIGKVDSLFSCRENIRVLDLPIYMHDQGWRIPDYLNQFNEIIDMVTTEEEKYGLDNHYVYITVDQKLVKCGNTGRRKGAHSDAFMMVNNKQIDITSEHGKIVEQESGEVSHTYVVYDCLPTEFFTMPFPIVNTDCSSVMETFDEIADNSSIVQYPNHTLLRLDPYVVHRSTVAETDTYRTFVKVSVSNKKYARMGNTYNDWFDYDWTMKERNNNERNHPW